MWGYPCADWGSSYSLSKGGYVLWDHTSRWIVDVFSSGHSQHVEINKGCENGSEY